MCRSIAYKNNSWNTERVRRNLSYKKIGEHFKYSSSHVSKWFSGSLMPSTDQIIEMCRWFTELDPDHPIDFEMGKMEFDDISNHYKVCDRTGRKASFTNTDGSSPITMPHKRGRTPKTKIGKIVYDRGLLYYDLSNITGVSINKVKRIINGYVMADDDFIIKLAAATEIDAEQIEWALMDAYNERHNVPNQMDISDMYTEQVSEAVTDVTDVTEDPEVSHEETDVKEITEENLDVWFSRLYGNLDNDLVIRILQAYVNFDYDMSMALEHIFMNSDDGGRLNFKDWVNIINLVGKYISTT